jgi:hypothetical protein
VPVGSGYCLRRQYAAFAGVAIVGITILVRVVACAAPTLRALPVTLVEAFKFEG